jgi:uncharacterized protein YbjT (DUF2867 family)
MPIPKILVTGATGTTGNAVVRQLSAAGIPARALVRNPAKAASVDLPHIEIIAGDLSDPASLAIAMEGVEALYLNIVPSTESLHQIDNAIAAAKAAGLSTIVKLSGLLAACAIRGWPTQSSGRIHFIRISWVSLMRSKRRARFICRLVTHISP